MTSRLFLLNTLLLLSLLGGLPFGAKAQITTPSTFLLDWKQDIDTSRILMEGYSPDREKAFVIFVWEEKPGSAIPPVDPGNKAGFIIEADLSQLDGQRKYHFQTYCATLHKQQWYWQLAHQTSIKAKDLDEARHRYGFNFLTGGPEVFWNKDWFPKVIEE